MFDRGWLFSLLPPDSTMEDAAGSAFVPVSMPHDWQIHDTSDLYRDGDGWYRKTLQLSVEDLKGHVFLDFDGVYMDSSLYVNGVLTAAHAYGYSPWLVDLTPWAREGENELLLKVAYRSPNTRWYSGAGIFRVPRLLKLPETCIMPFSLAVDTRFDGTWTLEGMAEIMGTQSPDVRVSLRDQGQEIACTSARQEPGRLRFSLNGLSVTPWSPETPSLYTLVLTLPGQAYETAVGFRTVQLDPDRGLILNGQRTRLRGVCLHHDAGCLGSAFHPQAFLRQMQTLKAYGVNALRTSHNPPAREALDICDRLGIMVIDEAYDMWEMPKTKYDYARFFRRDAVEDIQAMVRRDRNHPCVLFWSIGNEIPDTHHSPSAPRVTRALRDAVRRADPFRHGEITIGSNYMPWAGAQACAEELKVPGYNYAENLYDLHHAEHPDWVIYGSETASIVSSRGIYHFPMDAEILCDEDRQCSSLGNSHTSWGHQDLKTMLCQDNASTYSMGQFVWSGTDYLGEPTPYHTRNSYFGFFDTCCFPKDSAFLYRAFWTRSPFVHIGVSWDWNPGQIIDVPVMTNLPRVELFLGDERLGVREVDLTDPEKALPVWHIPYSPLPLRAVAEDRDGRIFEAVRLPSGDPCRLCLKRESQTPGPLSFVDVSVLDSMGRPVENACDFVRAETEGPVRILGMDNGDSTDTEGYTVTGKRLFSGRMLIVLEALSDQGEGILRVHAPGLEEAVLTLHLDETFCGVTPEDTIVYEPARDTSLRVRKILLEPLSSTYLTPENPAAAFRLTLFPEHADNPELHFRITNRAGIDSPCAAVTLTDGNTIEVKGLGDGELYLRATASRNGQPYLISQMELHLSGFGSPCLDPYGFIAGGLYDDREGDIAPGNEHGFAFARDGVSAAIFHNVDFGRAGSDRITIPVFALDSEPHRIRLYEGRPEDGRLIQELVYCKPSIWNVYQEETWDLPFPLTGVKTLSFQSEDKVHMKGFSFARQSRAFRLLTGRDADSIFGDAYEVQDTRIRHIGNNVSVTFADLDFGTREACMLSIRGSTDLKCQSITVRIEDQSGKSISALCEFREGTDTLQTFPVPVLPGLCRVTLIFLPGSRFDFDSLQFAPGTTDLS